MSIGLARQPSLNHTLIHITHMANAVIIHNLVKTLFNKF